MKSLKKIDWKDVGERAVKTFVEAFVASVLATDVLAFGEAASLRSMVLSTVMAAIAAGVSAVWNMLGSIISKEV